MTLISVLLSLRPSFRAEPDEPEERAGKSVFRA